MNILKYLPIISIIIIVVVFWYLDRSISQLKADKQQQEQQFQELISQVQMTQAVVGQAQQSNQAFPSVSLDTSAGSSASAAVSSGSVSRGDASISEGLSEGVALSGNKKVVNDLDSSNFANKAEMGDYLLQKLSNEFGAVMAATEQMAEMQPVVRTMVFSSEAVSGDDSKAGVAEIEEIQTETPPTQQKPTIKKKVES